MDPNLAHLINLFRKAQDAAVDTLINKLSIPQPESNLAWAIYCAENGLHHLREINGVGVYAHGYGVEVELPDIVIDFDWGANGEANGFDGWRLYNFKLANRLEIPCTQNGVNEWLDRAHGEGELIEREQLYYET